MTDLTIKPEEAKQGGESGDNPIEFLGITFAPFYSIFQNREKPKKGQGQQSLASSTVIAVSNSLKVFFEKELERVEEKDSKELKAELGSIERQLPFLLKIRDMLEKKEELDDAEAAALDLFNILDAYHTSLQDTFEEIAPSSSNELMAQD